MPYYNPAHAEVSPARPTEIYFACICFDLPWNMMRVNLAFNVWDKPNILPWIFEQSRSDAQCLVTRYVCFLYATLTIGEKRKHLFQHSQSLWPSTGIFFSGFS